MDSDEREDEIKITESITLSLSPQMTLSSPATNSRSKIVSSKLNLTGCTAIVPGSPLACPMPSKPSKRPCKLSDEISETVEEGRYKWLVDIRDENGNKPDDPDHDPRTLFIPPHQWAKFTPFEKQFWEIKSKLMDTVVFFKKGKFYELYEGDADIGAKRFDLKITDRVNMRMAGVPEATFEYWVGKFVSAGYRIARVDQTETSISKGMKDRESRQSKASDKIIKRELSTILTSGTLVDPGLLSSDLPTYCMSIKKCGNDTFGIAFVDASTANFGLCALDDDHTFAKLVTVIMQLRPKELIIAKGNMEVSLIKTIQNILPASTINYLTEATEFWDSKKTIEEINKSEYFEVWPNALSTADCNEIALSAFGGLISYLRTLKLDKSLLSNCAISSYDPLKKCERLILDGPTLSNLDIITNSCVSVGGDHSKGTLFGLLDHCVTPFGRRLFKLWVCHPLQKICEIKRRLDTIEYLIGESRIFEMLQNDIKGLPDLERMLARINSGVIKVSEFLTFLVSFERILGLTVKISECLNTNENTLSYHLINLISEMPDFGALLSEIKESFDHKIAITNGTIVPEPGKNIRFDSARYELEQVKEELAEHLKLQQSRLNCSKILYRDLGKEIFQLEIPSNVEVPPEFVLMSKTKVYFRYYFAANLTYVVR
jgi:DNA mismatch repair protein MSH6